MDKKQKAAFILGMTRAFGSVGFPKHFSEDDKSAWLQRAKWAVQMLGEGVFNPLHAYAVIDLVDDEMRSFADG